MCMCVAQSRFGRHFGDAELRSVLRVSLNAQYILCFLDHLSPITEQWRRFNF